MGKARLGRRQEAELFCRADGRRGGLGQRHGREAGRSWRQTGHVLGRSRNGRKWRWSWDGWGWKKQ